MGLGDVWSRALVYFGIAEEEEYWDEDSFSAEDELDRSYQEQRNVRRLPRKNGRGDDNSWADRTWTELERPPRASLRLDRAERGERHERGERSERPERGERSERIADRAERRRGGSVSSLRPVPSVASRVHLVVPKSFNDAQSVADRFKESTPVIVNLQSADGELSKRLIDFASGLTYALDGTMQRVADRVFLLTPRNVELSAEERQRFADRGFFDQA